VDLATREAMERIVGRSEEVFDGRRLLIKDGKNFEGRPAVRTQRYHVQSTGTIPVGRGGGVDGVENGEGGGKGDEVEEKSEKVQKEKKVKKVRKEKVEV
jgi:hypothetical protein